MYHYDPQTGEFKDIETSPGQTKEQYASSNRASSSTSRSNYYNSQYSSYPQSRRPENKESNCGCLTLIKWGLGIYLLCLLLI